MKGIFSWVSLFFLLALIATGASAQTAAKLSLRSIDASQFPLISGYLDARDAAGNLIEGLEAEDFFVFEDGSADPLENLRMVTTGWRLAVAINPGEGFAIRDLQGISRYDYVRERMLAWGQGLQGDESAQLALISANGVLSGYSEAEAWLAALNNYNLEFSSVRPDLQALESALLVARQPTEQAGVASAVWLITGAPDPEQLGQLEALADQAASENIPIFVWLADSSALFESDEVVALRNLAFVSGGRFFAFSGEEEFPNAADYFQTLASVYTFQYQSKIRSAGSHEVRLSLESDSLSIESQGLSFDLDLRLPTPLLISPPSLVQRAPSEEDSQVLAPFSQPIALAIEFPDNFERAIERSSLIVNGEVVAENLSEPFTRFAWDLRPYVNTQQVLLRVEVEDELGLVGSSPDIEVNLSVVPVETSLWVTMRQNWPLAAGIASLLIGASMFLVFVLSEQIGPESRLRRRMRAAAEPVESDPLLDSPISIQDMARPAEDRPGFGRRNQDRASMVEAATGLEAAYLKPLSEGGDQAVKDVIVLAGHDFVIGSDEEQSYYMVSDPSVEAQHSSIRRLENGGFELADMGTESGTWLNYAPVTGEGARIHDGDLIHVGRVPFRFLLRKDGPLS